MKRRTLDVLLSLGGLVLAGLLPGRRTRPHQQRELRGNYVTEQLSAQNITFKAADALTDEERAKPGLVENAGKQLTTGKQAEIYANDFIGLHLESTANGMTYAGSASAEPAPRPGCGGPEDQRAQPRRPAEAAGRRHGPA